MPLYRVEFLITSEGQHFEGFLLTQARSLKLAAYAVDRQLEKVGKIISITDLDHKPKGEE